MGNRGFLIVCEVAFRGEAVADEAERERGVDVGESAGLGHADLFHSLGLGSDIGTEPGAVGFGRLIYFLKSHYRLAVGTRSTAQQDGHSAPCEQSKIVHKMKLY